MLFNALKKAFALCRENILFVVIIAMLDIAFFFFLGFFSSWFVDSIVQLSFQISTAIPQVDAQGSILQMVFHPAIAPFTWKVLFWMAVLGFVVYVVYSIFQGSAWYLAKNIIQTTSYMEYTKRFFRLNITWFLLFTLFFILFTVLDVRLTVMASLLQTTKPWVAFVPLYAFLAFIFYFAFISYGMEKVKAAFVSGWKKKKSFLIMYAIIIGILLVVQGLLTIVGWINGYFMFTLGVLLIPLLAYVRVFIFTVVKKNGLLQ